MTGLSQREASAFSLGHLCQFHLTEFWTLDPDKNVGLILTARLGLPDMAVLPSLATLTVSKKKYSNQYQNGKWEEKRNPAKLGTIFHGKWEEGNPEKTLF